MGIPGYIFPVMINPLTAFRRNNSDLGQSLLEVTITLGIAVSLILALTVITLQGLQSSQFSQNQVQATKLAQEGLERVRFLRNANIPVTVGVSDFNWYGTPPLIWDWDFQTYQPLIDCNNCRFQFDSCTEGVCSLQAFSGQGEKIPNSPFTREIRIEDSDTNQKKITARVSWTDISGVHESKLITILSNH